MSKKNSLEAMRLPELWERFREITGESSRSPNRKYLIRRMEETLAARANAARITPLRRTARGTTPAETPPAPAVEPVHAPAPRGRFVSMTIEELQSKYLDVVGRTTSSSNRNYLCWKIREAEKGHIYVGPRKTRTFDGEPPDVTVLPLRLRTDAIGKMDEVWRARGIQSRMEFLRRAIGHYLTRLGACDVAAMVTSSGPTAA